MSGPPDVKGVIAVVVTVVMLITIIVAATKCSNYKREKMEAQRAAELAELEKHCEAQPKACAATIQSLAIELAEEKDKAGVGTGYILGKLF